MLLTRRSASSGRAMRSWHVTGDAIGLFYGLLGVLKGVAFTGCYAYRAFCLMGMLRERYGYLFSCSWCPRSGVVARVAADTRLY